MLHFCSSPIILDYQFLLFELLLKAGCHCPLVTFVSYQNGYTRISALLSLVTFSCVMNNNGYIFMGAFQAHQCKLPMVPENATNFTYKANPTIKGGKIITDVHKLGKRRPDPASAKFCYFRRLLSQLP